MDLVSPNHLKEKAWITAMSGSKPSGTDLRVQVFASGSNSTMVSFLKEEFNRLKRRIKQNRTYRGFVDDGGAGHDIIALGRLVGDSLGEGVVLHPLVELCSVFRYVEVSPQTLTSGEVEENRGQQDEEHLCKLYVVAVTIKLNIV